MDLKTTLCAYSNPSYEGNVIWRRYKVILMLWTLDGRQNNVVLAYIRGLLECRTFLVSPLRHRITSEKGFVNVFYELI